MNRFQIFTGFFVVILVGGVLIAVRVTREPASAEAAIMAGIDTSLPADQQLRQAYDAKLDNDAYVAYKSGQGGERYQTFREEAAIKLIRKQLAGKVHPAQGAELNRIPLTSTSPKIDGKFDKGEWDNALSIDTSTDGSESKLYLTATSKHLYLACDAPSDTTEDGFDQFRFYIHVGLSPLIVNERIHVGKSHGPLGGIRQTKVQWKGSPAKSDADRWKRFPISDWSIYQHAFGASSVRGHRRFEAVLNSTRPAWLSVSRSPRSRKSNPIRSATRTASSRAALMSANWAHNRSRCGL
ncbi:MAG: hypothetical protein IPK83_24380 [Planctomycetes bacterium]|nr:hypothetical protein [Planctomycetota bacterium]